MRTFAISEELLQYCKEYFPEFEFLFMLFGVIMVLFAIVLHLKLFFPDMIDTNLVLYLTFVVIMVTFQNLNRDAFSAGYRKLSDETKVSLLFAVKTFILVWIMLTYTDGAAAKFVGLDVDGAHTLLIERANKITEVIGGRLILFPEITYLLLSSTAAFISFTVVRQSISFGFYFFFMTRAASKSHNSGYFDAVSANRRFSFKTLIRILYMNFFAPVVVAFLFI